MELPPLLHANPNLRLQPHLQILGTAPGGEMHRQRTPLPRHPHHQHDHRRPDPPPPHQHAHKTANQQTRESSLGSSIRLLEYNSRGQRSADMGHDRRRQKPGFHMGVRAQQRCSRRRT